tara:strand:- start:1747 stop:2034 length:288 start_codon:yes stop_codon:yes gene_type:complete
MKNVESITKENNNPFNGVLKNWNNLDDSYKAIFIKIWKVISYKWQWQILLNLPFLIWWLLDYSVPAVHEFDINLVNSLNLPDWLTSFMGLNRPTN